MTFEQQIEYTHASLRIELAENPIGKRVILPDGTKARVKRVGAESGTTVYKVQGLTHNSGYRSLKGQRSWFTVDEFTFEFMLWGVREGF